MNSSAIENHLCKFINIFLCVKISDFRWKLMILEFQNYSFLNKAKMYPTVQNYTCRKRATSLFEIFSNSTVIFEYVLILNLSKFKRNAKE